ncbi:zinc ribbon domain-containing protein [Mycobacterium sp. PSTR-4-N]|uniref:zinc ribbon domain-containing protein n=1 Tax=Mycobacterium sp. PSTR-4-N TaxID=2917745 RepID=UPI001F1544F3|nr:zinc ribbon domain-containing protein [Mycobacterium sp. PSTR-4-N]MCG7593696.1 zinc ribbon domain-containing protein [Mycobacterium sp. PSTR-4-N]
MILYAFRCTSGCGTTQQMHPMDSRPDEVDCPTCRGPARRMISAPHLGSGGAAMALHDATRATADRPAVVSSPTARTSGRRVSTNPRHQNLPRP